MSVSLAEQRHLEEPTSPPPQVRHRSDWYLSGAFGVALLAAAYGMRWLGMNLVTVGHLVGAAAFVWFMVADKELAVYGLFTYCTFEGMLKMLTNSDPLFQLGRDLIVIAMCLGAIGSALSKGKGIRLETPLDRLLIAFILVCLAQLFNPMSPGLAPSVAALRLHITMLPLFWFGYYVFTRKEQIIRFFWVFSILTTIVAGVAIMQYLRGPEYLRELSESYEKAANWYRWSDEEGNSYLRPPSTTSTSGGGSTYMQLGIPLLLALILLPGTGATKLVRSAMIGVLVFWGTALLICGIRGSVLLVGIELCAFAWFLRKQFRLAGVAFLALTIVSAGVLSLQKASQLTGGKIGLRYQETFRDPLRVWQERRAGSLSIFLISARDHPFGVGMGRAGSTVTRYGYLMGGLMANSETYWSGMVAETGLPGLGLMLWITLSVIGGGMWSCRSTPDRDSLLLQVAILTVVISIFLNWFGCAPMFTPPFNITFWLLAGMLSRTRKAAVVVQQMSESSCP